MAVRTTTPASTGKVACAVDHGGAPHQAGEGAVSDRFHARTLANLRSHLSRSAEVAREPTHLQRQPLHQQRNGTTMTGSNDANSRAQPEGERWWPPSLAIVVLIGIPFLLPGHVFPRWWWLATPLQLGLLVAMLLADPGRIDRRSQRIRRLSIALTSIFAAMAVFATVCLVVELVDGAPDLDAASDLLAIGFAVWIIVNLTFSLLYWQLDGGGPAERLHDRRAHPDLAFPEHMNPDIARPGWRPIYFDYLYLAFTNATAFSPTDVMPIARWAKLAMATQAILSLVILSLVIANAVNTLGS
jgi:uncharacterized membrane protein